MTILFGAQRPKGFEIITDCAVHFRRDLYLLTAVGQNIDINLFDLCHALLLAVHVKDWCQLLQLAVLFSDQ